jgi:hypothetical protein
MKKRSAAIARIPALQPGPIRALYKISGGDARRLLSAAGVEYRGDRATVRGSAQRLELRGAGFGDPEKNRKVEQAAMRACGKYLTRRGWKVKDVHLENRGYDLLCRRSGSTRHVEVKGSSGSVFNFPITKRERDEWQRSSSFVLALVTRALSPKPATRLFDHEDFRRFRFVPLAFMASWKRRRPN